MRAFTNSNRRGAAPAFRKKFHDKPIANDKDNSSNIPMTNLNWRRLLGYLRPYTGRMILAIVALLVSSGLGLAFPLVIVQLLDTVTRVQDTAPLNLLAAMLVGLFLLQSAFTFVQSYLLNYIGEHIVLICAHRCSATCKGSR